MNNEAGEMMVDDDGVPAVSFMDDANDSGVISTVPPSGLISVCIGLPTVAVAGGRITVTTDAGSTEIALAAEDIASGKVAATVVSPGEGETLEVSATYTDLAGNISAPGMDAAVIDTQATPGAVPVVTILAEVDAVGVISATSLRDFIDVQIELPANAAIGGRIAVSDGVTALDVTLQAADLVVGFISARFANPGAGSVFRVAATLTDMDGAVSAPGVDIAQIGS